MATKRNKTAGSGRLQRLVRRLSWPPALMLSDCPGRIAKSNGAAIISIEVAEGIGGEEQNRCWKGQEHYPIAEREPPNGLDRDERWSALALAAARASA